MPHVTFGENHPARRSHEESRTVIKIPAKNCDEQKKIVRQRSRTISYKIPDERPKPCHTTKPADKICIERKITYKDLDGNIIKIVYEDSCGKIIRTIYPTLPPRKCSPPPAPSPPKCSSPPVSEPSNIPSEDVRNCNWTKIVVKNSRGVVWKIVHVDCDGKTMKTEYPESEPEPEPPKRRSIETKRYVIKELDDAPPRRRYSETKKIVIQKDSRESGSGSGSNVSAKETDLRRRVEATRLRLGGILPIVQAEGGRLSPTNRFSRMRTGSLKE
jgi:hypothetical protein